jgi:2,4-dienoyl-CoA reductase-like NADH-dependent reductase (Old Yellow Enzyme family)/thioredoxin reductase
MTNFARLFEPGKMGKMELKNRIIFAPCGTHYSTMDGLVSERQRTYYAERAKGGAGLLIIEGASCRKIGKPGRILVNEDKYIPYLKKLADAIHENGAKAVMQMSSHRGSTDEVDPASPSGMPHPFAGSASSHIIPLHPRVITAFDLEQLILEYGEAARRVMEAGFDGVMLHGANGYLPCELLSRRFNKRTDAYGGDLKGRAKFLLDMIRISREKTAPDFPVLLRLMGSDRVSKPGDEGWGIDDCVALCKIVEAAGVTAIDITSGSQETPDWTGPAWYMPPGLNTDVTTAIKKAGVKVPVSVVGKIAEPALAEEILAEGKADFISMARALICDPYWPKKVQEGKLDDICPCIYDKRCLEDVIVEFIPMSCTTNPLVGHEKDYAVKMERLTKKKKVLVLGGGPGGMQAAITASQKGHDVTLYEKSDKLGGQLILAAVPPDKQYLNNYLKYLKIQLAKSDVKVKLNKEATPSEVAKFAPDSVIVAVGSSPFIPEIPGIAGKNVLTYQDVLSGQKKPGQKVIVLGGGYVGCETCFYLAKKGIEVTLVFRSAQAAHDIKYWVVRRHYLDKLKEMNIKVMAEIQYRDITAAGLNLTDKTGAAVFVAADNIILAAGATPNKALGEALKGKYLEFAQIGDCVEPRRIREAVEEGIWAAAAI